MNPQIIAQYFLKFAKRAKFCQIWSHRTEGTRDRANSNYEIVNN